MVREDDKRNAGGVKVAPCHGARNQRWRLVPAGDAFQLASASAGTCLNVKDARHDEGAPVEPSSCATTDSQLFSVRPGAQDTQLVATHSGKCVAVAPGTTKGAALVQVACARDAAQTWRVQRSLSLKRLQNQCSSGLPGGRGRILLSLFPRFGYISPGCPGRAPGGMPPDLENHAMQILQPFSVSWRRRHFASQPARPQIATTKVPARTTSISSAAAQQSIFVAPTRGDRQIPSPMAPSGGRHIEEIKKVTDADQVPGTAITISTTSRAAWRSRMRARKSSRTSG